MREIRLSGSMWRGPETERWRTYTGTKLETADTDKGSLHATAPAPDPTIERHAVVVEEDAEIVAPTGEDAKLPAARRTPSERYTTLVSEPYRAAPPPQPPSPEDPDVAGFRRLIARGRRASWLLWLIGATWIALWAFAPGSPITTFFGMVVLVATFSIGTAAWFVQTTRKRRAKGRHNVPPREPSGLERGGPQLRVEPPQGLGPMDRAIGHPGAFSRDGRHAAEDGLGVEDGALRARRQ